MKKYSEFLKEQFGLKRSDYTKIANSVYKDLSKNKNKEVDIEELVGIHLENYPGAEFYTDKDVNVIVKMVNQKVK